MILQRYLQDLNKMVFWICYKFSYHAGLSLCYGLSELEDKVGPGTSKGIADATISVAPGSPSGEVIRSFIEQVKEWYDGSYWYPGEGGINTTADDVNGICPGALPVCI